VGTAGGISIGNAWLNVVPAMNGVAPAINKALGGVDISPATRGMGSKITSGIGSAFSAVAKTGVAAFAAVGAAAVANLGRAVSRTDILNNFPKIMQNLGYSADDADVSVKKISDRLDGLPSSLDGVVSMVQQLAPITSGMDEATNVGLAFNDMLLASGKSTADQSRAMLQYTQMLSKGKPDMMAWRTMQEVMPGQLDQMAHALLGTTANSNDLYSAMMDGTVSFQDFNDAMLQLDKEGVNGFASFSQQAQDATKGIQTALDNVRNRTSKAMSAVIQAVGAEDIASKINEASSGIVTLGDKISNTINRAQNVGDLDVFGRSLVTVAGGVAAAGAAGAALKNWDDVSSVLEVFNKLPGKVGDSLSSAAGAVSSKGGAFINGVDMLFHRDLAEAATMDGDPFGAAVQRVQTGLSQLGAPFKSIGTKVSGWMAPFTSAISSNFEAAKVKAGSGMSSVGDALRSAASKVGDFASPVTSRISAVGEKITGALSPVKSGIGNVFGGLFDGVSGPLQSGLGKVGDLIGKFFKPGNFMKFFGLGALVAAVVAGLGALMSQGGGEMLAQFSATMAELPGKIADLVGQLSSQMPVFMQTGVDVIMALLTGIIQNLPAILQGAADILSTLVSGLGAALPTLIPMAVQVIITLVTGLLGALPQIVTAGLNLLVGLVQGIIGALPNLIAAIPAIIFSIVNTLVTALPEILMAGVQILMALISGITSMIPMLVQMLPTIIESTVSTLVQNLPLIVDAGIQLLVALITGLANALPQLIAMVPTIILTIVQVLGQSFPKLVTAGLNAIGQLVSGLVQAFPTIWGAIKQVPGGILSALGSVGSLLWSAGSSIIGGLWEGMKSAFETVKSWVSGIASWIQEHKGPKAYDLALLVPNGGWIMQGLGTGLEREFQNVLGDVGSMGARLQAELSGSVIPAASVSPYVPSGNAASTLPAVYVENPWTGDQVRATVRDQAVRVVRGRY
jgi:tape measure domain-containing protein